MRWTRREQTNAQLDIPMGDKKPLSRILTSSGLKFMSSGKRERTFAKLVSGLSTSKTFWRKCGSKTTEIITFISMQSEGGRNIDPLIEPTKISKQNYSVIPLKALVGREMFFKEGAYDSYGFFSDAVKLLMPPPHSRTYFKAFSFPLPGRHAHKKVPPSSYIAKSVFAACFTNIYGW